MTGPLARRMMVAAAAAGSAVAVAGGSGAAASAPQPPGTLAPLHGPYAPAIDPADFVKTVDNRYLPYRPGTRFRFQGVEGTTRQTDDQVVERRTKRILGIDCTIVRDTVSERGRVIERTDDWFAQDRQGNVWYLGEDSFERSGGRLVKAPDSWKSGVDGARPCIIMPAPPRPGDAYRQEHYPAGGALDQARVLRVGASLTVPYGHFRHLLVTSERSPLEPQVERKYYAPGVGEIAERVVKGHHEAFTLVRVTRTREPRRPRRPRPRRGRGRARGASATRSSPARGRSSQPLRRLVPGRRALTGN